MTGVRRDRERPLKLAVSRGSVHAADDGGRLIWAVPDGARWRDLALAALESRFLLRHFEWVLVAQGRELVRIRWVDDGVEVATTRHAGDAVAKTWDRRGDGRVSWEPAPLPRVWWARAPRFRVDAALTARADEADRTGESRAAN